MSTITLNDILPYLKTPVIPEGEEGKYQTFIDNAEAVVKSFLGYSPEKSSYLETYIYPNRIEKLVLRNAPVSAIYYLKVNGTSVSDSEAYIDLENGIVHFPNFGAEECQTVIELDYDAGHESVPLPIKDATCKLVAWEVGKSNSGNYGVKSQMVGEATTSFELDIPINIKNQLSKFVRNNLFAGTPVSRIYYQERT